MTIQQELNQLPASCHLFSKNTWRLYLVTAQQAPDTVRLLQQLRATAFELEANDTLTLYNYYDAYHHHLVLWDSGEQAFVGAYRIGFIQEMIQQHGLDKICLLADGVFRLSRAFLDQHPGLIELSGLFIQPQYQRNYHSLLTLWKGIHLSTQRLPCTPGFLGQIDFTPTPNANVVACLANFFERPEFQWRENDAIASPQELRLHHRQLYADLTAALTAVGFDCNHPSLIMLKHYLAFPIKCLAQANKTIFGPAYNVLMFSPTMNSVSADRVGRSLAT